MIKVLFVCLGNICRSPIAEGVFRDLVEKEGLSDAIQCDSAGTASYHIGSMPDRRMPDPYYEDIAAFEEVYLIVERCGLSLLDFIIEKNNLKP